MGDRRLNSVLSFVLNAAVWMLIGIVALGAARMTSRTASTVLPQVRTEAWFALGIAVLALIYGILGQRGSVSRLLAVIWSVVSILASLVIVIPVILAT